VTPQEQEPRNGAVTWPRIISILKLPALLTIFLPLALLVASHQGTSHKPRLAVAADNPRVRPLSDVQAGEIPVTHIVASADTIHAVPTDYAIDSHYVQQVFTRFAVATGRPAPRNLDRYSRASGFGGIGIFFLVFPVMMAGAMTTIVLLRRPSWGMGRRVVLVAVVGAVSALGAYLTAVGLELLPGKPALLAYAFLLTQFVNCAPNS
jgi:hypothetical protein